MNEKKELQVAALENGTVIDHIPSDKVFTVVALLGLETRTATSLSEIISKARSWERKALSRWPTDILLTKK